MVIMLSLGNLKLALSAAIGGLLAMSGLTLAQAQGGLKTIDNSQGGKIFYGQVEGQITEAGAMGTILQSIHKQFGDRPQVGKLFQVRGTQSVAAFFSVNTRPQGNGQRVGLIIVTKVATNDVEAAVITDDAAHFGSTFNPMMKTLFGAWHPFETVASAATGVGGGSAPAVPLHKFMLPDRTASLDLPDGWKVQPTSGGGTILAEGPNGELATFGFDILVADLNHPGARRTYEMVQRGGLRGTSYAQGLYYPLGADLAKDYVDIVTMFRQKRNLPPTSIQIRTAVAVQAPPGQRCAHVTGVVNAQDSEKAMVQNMVFCVSAPTPAAGLFGAIINATAVPVALAEKERATMGAMMSSFWSDTALIQRMGRAYAAPAIASIQAVGRAAAAQAQAAHERNDIQNSAVYQHWDSMDRRSQEFSNYQLGYSVVQDNNDNAHGTLWNQDADALVKQDPQRFEYVNAPNFWKGIDY
jgi:hypothetical protein